MKIVLKILETLVCVPLTIVGSILLVPILFIYMMLYLVIGIVCDIWNIDL